MLECTVLMRKRRTKQQKQKAALATLNYEIDFKGVADQLKDKTEKKTDKEDHFLKHDLTKTSVISMLAVGSELALWWLLNRR